MNELALAIPWLGKRNPAAARWVVVALAVGAPLPSVTLTPLWEPVAADGICSL